MSIASTTRAMADITEHDPQQSPSGQDDALATGNGASAVENRGLKRSRVSAAADDDDDDDDKPGRERRKIEIKFIQDKSRRHITFSKRKAGIMKKVSQRQAFIPEVESTGLKTRRTGATYRASGFLHAESRNHV